jgi:starch-binding outer membrane protein, SusD/RagB family
MISKIRNSIIAMVFVALTSCTKNLDTPYQTTLPHLENVQDAQSLLDNPVVMNYNKPMLAEFGSDNFFVPGSIWGTLSPLYKYSYTWDQDPFRNEEVADWNKPYSVVIYSNLVIQTLEKLPALVNTDDYRNVMGQALFHRGSAFFDLAQLFCKPYTPSGAGTDLGIPLVFSTDATQKTKRSTVQQTYDQIIKDLTEAEGLLPATTNFKNRPSKAAANALLSRVYLSQGNFDSALVYASRALSINGTLVDYNLVPNISLPFRDFKHEVIWEAIMTASVVFNQSSACPIDSVLYNSYHDNDLRKTLFFSISGSNALFKGTYEGTRTAFKFCGLSVDELYLTRAECFARTGHINEAMNDLNTLMEKRWKNNTGFVPFTAGNEEEALGHILRERRKELVFRGTRWMDLRRLNVLGAGITIKRVVNGQTYTLEAGDKKYTYPIPKRELLLNPMPDNPR